MVATAENDDLQDPAGSLSVWLSVSCQSLLGRLGDDGPSLILLLWSIVQSVVSIVGSEKLEEIAEDEQASKNECQQRRSLVGANNLHCVRWLSEKGNEVGWARYPDSGNVRIRRKTFWLGKAAVDLLICGLACLQGANKVDHCTGRARIVFLQGVLGRTTMVRTGVLNMNLY